MRTLGTFLCIFLTFWGLFEDMRTWVSQNVEEFFRTFCWLLVDLLRTVFKNFWGLFVDHLMNIWGTFDDHRILRTLITFWGLWGRLEYLLWTYEDFEGLEALFGEIEDILRIIWEPDAWGRWGPFCAFSSLFEDFVDLLRNLRTLWGSVENLRSEYLGYLLFIFLTFCGLCGPFEDFLKTWGPDALRTLRNISGTFDDFLWTYRGPEAFEDFKDSSGHWGSLRTWLPTEELRTLINFWGLWGRFDYLLRTFEEFEDFEDLLSNLRNIWGPETWGRWGPFVHFLDLLWALWTFRGVLEDLRTWCSLNIEEPFRNFWWILVDLLSSWGLWGIQGLFRTLRIFANLTTYWGIEDVDKFLRTLRTTWVSFEDLWGIRRLWGPFE